MCEAYGVGFLCEAYKVEFNFFFPRNNLYPHPNLAEGPSVSDFFSNIFIVFSFGRGVRLPARWVQWHSLGTISTEEGAVPQVSASV